MKRYSLVSPSCLHTCLGGLGSHSIASAHCWQVISKYLAAPHHQEEAEVKICFPLE
ncbi:hypothetical protein GDO81_015240 [Engystomops pustulosus]|uniref:Uncharacterized protein n=1 Tax=Engystomops pustulosus TaxID=76066 RepID=A0AAV7AQM8_ENGPU|nr:hypothetical protein GDO81_015240 [Engystomops pustulosus]